MQKFEYTVLELVESVSRVLKTQPLNLGGIAGAGGGVGGPPGGFIGWLPQTRAAYDNDEIATDFTPASGMSLLDNLNHIRYRLNIIESGGSVAVFDDNTNAHYYDVDTIHFSGAGVTVLDLGSGDIQIQITASGGTGFSNGLINRNLQTDLTIPSGYSMVVADYFNENGHTLTIEGDGVLAVIGGESLSGGLSPLYYDSLTVQAPGTHFNLAQAAVGTVLLFYNTTLQSSDTFTMDVDNLGLTTSFTVNAGDTLVAVYGVTAGFIATYADISANDPSTDVTGAELEQLSDGSQTTLHSHATNISNGSAVLGATFNMTGASGTYEDTGLSITLPSAGTYKITCDARAAIQGSAGSFWWVLIKLYNSTDAADIANSERIPVYTNVTGTQFQNTCSINKIVTVGASKVIKLYAARSGYPPTPTWTVASIGSDSNGRTELMYEKLA